MPNGYIELHFPVFFYHALNKSGNSFAVCDTNKITYIWQRGESLGWGTDWTTTKNDLPAGVIDWTGRHFPISIIKAIPKPPFPLSLPISLLFGLTVGSWRRFRFDTPEQLSLDEFKEKVVCEMARSKWAPSLMRAVKDATSIEAVFREGFEYTTKASVSGPTTFPASHRMEPHSEHIRSAG